MDPKLVEQALYYHGLDLLNSLRREQQEIPPSPVLSNIENRHTRELEIKDPEFQKKLISFIARKSDLIFDTTNRKEKVLDKNEEIDDSYAIMPAMEVYMEVPSLLRRQHFFSSIKALDCVTGVVTDIVDSGLRIQLLCVDRGRARDIEDLEIIAFCSVKDLPKLYANESALEAFQTKDIVRGIVVAVDVEYEKITLSLHEKSIPDKNLYPRIGLITEDDFPVYFRRKAQIQGMSYEEMMQSILGFTNQGNVQTLLHQLGVQEQTSLFRCPARLKIPEKEYAEGLRKWQTQKLAHQSLVQGVDMFKQGKYMEAMQHLNRALQIDKENVEALVARGALFDNNVQVSWNHDKIKFNAPLALRYANNENFAHAIKDFKEALGINPKHSNAKHYLVETLLTAGKIAEDKRDLDEACDYYSQAVKADPDHKEAKDMLMGCQKLMVFQSISSESSKTKEPETSVLTKTAEKLKQLIHEDEKEKPRSRSKKKKKNARKSASDSPEKKKRKRKRSTSSSDSSSSGSESSVDTKKKKKRRKKLRKSSTSSIQSPKLLGRTRSPVTKVPPPKGLEDEETFSRIIQSGSTSSYLPVTSKEYFSSSTAIPGLSSPSPDVSKPTGRTEMAIAERPTRREEEPPGGKELTMKRLPEDSVRRRDELLMAERERFYKDNKDRYRRFRPYSRSSSASVSSRDSRSPRGSRKVKRRTLSRSTSRSRSLDRSWSRERGRRRPSARSTSLNRSSPRRSRLSSSRSRSRGRHINRRRSRSFSSSGSSRSRSRDKSKNVLNIKMKSPSPITGIKELDMYLGGSKQYLKSVKQKLSLLDSFLPSNTSAAKYTSSKSPPSRSAAIYASSRSPPARSATMYTSSRSPPNRSTAKYRSSKSPPTPRSLEAQAYVSKSNLEKRSPRTLRRSRSKSWSRESPTRRRSDIKNSHDQSPRRSRGLSPKLRHDLSPKRSHDLSPRRSRGLSPKRGVKNSDVSTMHDIRSHGLFPKLDDKISCGLSPKQNPIRLSPKMRKQELLGKLTDKTSPVRPDLVNPVRKSSPIKKSIAEVQPFNATITVSGFGKFGPKDANQFDAIGKQTAIKRDDAGSTKAMEDAPAATMPSQNSKTEAKDSTTVLKITARTKVNPSSNVLSPSSDVEPEARHNKKLASNESTEVPSKSGRPEEAHPGQTVEGLSKIIKEEIIESQDIKVDQMKPWPKEVDLEKEIERRVQERLRQEEEKLRIERNERILKRKFDEDAGGGPSRRYSEATNDKYPNKLYSDRMDYQNKYNPNQGKGFTPRGTFRERFWRGHNQRGRFYNSYSQGEPASSSRDQKRYRSRSSSRERKRYMSRSSSRERKRYMSRSSSRERKRHMSRSSSRERKRHRSRSSSKERKRYRSGSSEKESRVRSRSRSKESRRKRSTSKDLKSGSERKTKSQESSISKNRFDRKEPSRDDSASRNTSKESLVKDKSPAEPPVTSPLRAQPRPLSPSANPEAQAPHSKWETADKDSSAEKEENSKKAESLTELEKFLIDLKHQKKKQWIAEGKLKEKE
ncbi:serine/arginine repetitive matrix protein 2 [Biomphalaria glabrata]|nr:serine/arginine repetitive matrix protein 2-like [Biomphalaria glabrata]